MTLFYQKASYLNHQTILIDPPILIKMKYKILICITYFEEII